MKKYKNLFFDWIIPIAIAIVAALLIRKFVFFTIKVPTGSMQPTIAIGDKIIVTKVYNTNKLKRGDIIVFFSKEYNERMVKRLIGLPGDTVEVTEKGEVVINGKIQVEKYVVYNGGKTGSFKVPKDSFLFLGDDRPISEDSRWWKNPYISKDDIQGKARFVIMPLDRIGKLK